MSKHVKLTMAVGLGFGVVLWLLSKSALTGLVLGVIFGAGLGLSSARRERLLLERGFETGTMRPVQSRELLVSEVPERAFSAAVDALNTIRNIRKVEPDSTSGSIRAMVGINSKSLGEEILVSVRESENGSLISIKSEPMLPLIYYDGGKGVENVEVFAEYLLKRGASRRVA
jgi:hypothetical protein